MAPEIGSFALILAFGISLVQATLPLIGANRRDVVAMAFADAPATVPPPAGFGFWRFLRGLEAHSWQTAATEPLAEEEKRCLDELVNKGGA